MRDAAHLLKDLVQLLRLEAHLGNYGDNPVQPFILAEKNALQCGIQARRILDERTRSTCALRSVFLHATPNTP